MQRKLKSRIVVLGAGNFGTALAQHLARLDHEVDLLTDSQDLADSINSKRRHLYLFTQTQLLSNIKAHSHPDQLDWQDVRALVIAIPVQCLSKGVQEVVSQLPTETICISAAKGIETSSGDLPSQILSRILGDSAKSRIVVLSGPSFAHEIMEEQPTAIVAASESESAGATAQEIFHSKKFRTYLSSDLIGLEVAGALKNVIAVASGACEGLGYQKNSQAALISRGLAEISRFGQELGAEPRTFQGLGGVGDLFLTCSSEKSRNFRLGKLIGEKTPVDQALRQLGSVAEGYYSVKAAHALKENKNLYAPITDAVFKVLHQGQDIEEAVDNLLSQPPGEE